MLSFGSLSLDFIFFPMAQLTHKRWNTEIHFLLKFPFPHILTTEKNHLNSNVNKTIYQ